jgi:pantetheine-phosphate adenylyltransferase
MIAESVAHLDNVKVDSFAALVVDLARDVGADVIVKGLRVASDADTELMQAQMNRNVAGTVTLFIPATSKHSFVSSKFVRDFAKYGGADRIDSMVPVPVAKRLREKFAT